MLSRVLRVWIVVVGSSLALRAQGTPGTNAAAATAQQAESHPTFHTISRLVLVDVVVTGE
ncbi:MAG TPA: hypothetical protein VF133_04015 [Terriglobales bacterium]